MQGAASRADAGILEGAGRDQLGEGVRLITMTLAPSAQG